LAGRLFFSGSIRKTLTMLVGLALLPALLIILYSGLELRRNAIEKAKREVLLLARTMGEVQKGITHSAHQTLATLSHMQEVQSLDGLACRRIFSALIAKNPAYIDIVAMDKQGEVFASSKPFGMANLADRHHVRQALATRDFAVGEYIVTRIGQNVPTLPFAHPVLDAQGEPRAVLSAALRLESFAHFFDLGQMPADSFVAVIDQNGIRLFLHPAKQTNPVGEPIAQEAWNNAREAKASGISVHVGSDGVRRIFAFQPVRLSADRSPYMYMWAGIPEAAVLRPANRLLFRNLLLMLLAASLALAISWLVGEKSVVAPIKRLVATAHAFAGGHLHARSGIRDSQAELGQLSEAFDHMADRLIDSQERLRTIADYTYDWEYWMGPEGALRWVSPSCEKITGYSPSELHADPDLIDRMVHPADKAITRKLLDTLTGERRMAQADFRIIHKSGRTVWIDHHCVPTVRPDRTFLGWRVSNRDITDRKQMEKALQESEEQFRSLVEGAPDAIYVQIGSNFAYLNAAAQQLFGAPSAAHLLGQPVLARFHADYHDQVRERVRLIIQQRQSVPRTQRVCLRLDGHPVPVESSAVPITFKGQAAALVFLQDISERKQIEIRLQQARKMEAIGALAGGIAHDFNNMLTPIIGLSEILMDDLPAGSLNRENVTEIYNAARRAGDLVNQILSFSRQSEHKKIPLRIQQVLKEVGQLIRATIPSNIEIHQDLQDDCGPVLADPTNVHQIAMNLVTNAFHAVEQNNGRIAIGLRRMVLTQAQVDAEGMSLDPGPYALLEVSDTGHGIAEETIPKIFDPYFTTKPQGKGTGLGLSVVFGIVKAHGGDIRIDSRVGRGTTVKVYLPQLQREADSGQETQTIVHATGTERILLVDDEEPIVRLERQMLERLGYHVTTRTSSVAALEAFKADPDAYDLVITDMAMPNMTGDQLAEQIVAVRHDIPIVLCTGFSETLHLAKAGAVGIKGFLMKPLARGDLAAVVRKVLVGAVREPPLQRAAPTPQTNQPVKEEKE
jgi:PAS domain S-box-containing protein